MFYAVYGDHLFILRYFSFKETFLSVTLGRGFFPLARLKMSVPLVLSPSYEKIDFENCPALTV